MEVGTSAPRATPVWIAWAGQSYADVTDRNESLAVASLVKCLENAVQLPIVGIGLLPMFSREAAHSASRTDILRRLPARQRFPVIPCFMVKPVCIPEDAKEGVQTCPLFLAVGTSRDTWVADPSFFQRVKCLAENSVGNRFTGFRNHPFTSGIVLMLNLVRGPILPVCSFAAVALSSTALQGANQGQLKA